MKRSRPLIGVTASRRRGYLMWLLNKLAIWRAGGRALRLAPGFTEPIGRLQGVVIGGGDDIHPSLYGSDVVLTVKVDQERDRLEREIIGHAMRHGLPVLGICRGAQMLNVVQGGTLHTDIHAVYEEAPRMRTILPRKAVRIDPEARLCRILGRPAVRVNALHHQSIERVGYGLRIAAQDDYGIVQGVEAEGDRFIFGVQWHPEFLIFDSGQQALFTALVSTARDRDTEPG